MTVEKRKEKERKVRLKYKDADVPYVPNEPKVPNVQKVPNVPNVPKVPNVPYVPNVQNVPNVSNVPNVPKPKVPNVQNVPNMFQMFHANVPCKCSICSNVTNDRIVAIFTNVFKKVDK